MKAITKAALVYLLIGVVYAIYLNLLPGGPADKVFGPNWWNATSWWDWFVLPMLTWPILIWRVLK